MTGPRNSWQTLLVEELTNDSEGNEKKNLINL